MSEDIQKSRSPNSPRYDLSQALEITKKLHDKIGRSAVKAAVAMSALGYKGASGASLTTLGAVSQYGLIDRNAGNVQISPLAIKILHPVDEAQKASAMREAALTPRIFSEIYEKWNDMAEDSLANNLIHQEFTVDGAKRAASVYKINSTLVKLDKSVKPVPLKDEKPKPKQELLAPEDIINDGAGIHQFKRHKVLATFKIPLGSSEAELIFTGDRLEPEDFDALRDYVALFKKQYERKSKVVAAKSEEEAKLDKAIIENWP